VVSAEAVGVYTVSICQDGIRTREEECDDGVGGGQGCSMECTTEIGWVCHDTAAEPRSQNSQAEIKSKCRDCEAAAATAAIEAASEGRPPPPASTLNCPSGFYMGEVCGTCTMCPKGFFCDVDNNFPCKL
jgi:cysteine-rich repeat protein